MVKKFRRKSPHLKPEPKILIICEDSKSSLEYLSSAKRYYRVSENYKIIHCGKTDPDGIVKYAISNKSRYNEIFCVIDRDTHENFDAAVSRAAGNNIDLKVSYPSFEFWLLLHFTYSRRPYVASGGNSPAKCVENELKASDPMMNDYDKGDGVDYFQLLESRLGKAYERAERSMIDAEKDGEMNPSTEIHKILKRMEKDVL